MLRMRSAQPPLRRPALDGVTVVLQAACARNEAAWAFAVQAGAYEQLVRCMDAHAGDPDLQALCCTALGTLGHRGVDGVREFWAGHAEAAHRAGAVRAVVAALRAHGARCNELAAAATALDSMVTCDGPALAVARDGRAAEALAGGLPLALRSAAASGDTFVLELVVDALGALARLDGACARQAAARRGTLAALAEALRLHGRGSRTLASSVCLAMKSITAAATADECAPTADGCVAALRATLAAHTDALLQAVAWSCLKLLLTRDARAAARAGAAGTAADAVRTLHGFARVRVTAGEHADASLVALEAVCAVLSSVARTLEPSRRGALAADAVAALAAVLRAHGAAHEDVAAQACISLVDALETRPHNTHADVYLRLVADVTAVMRAHAGNVAVQLSASAGLTRLVMTPLLLAAAAGVAAPGASELARLMADAGALEAAACALRAHAVAGPERLRDDALAVLVMVCSGAALDDRGTPLQASVAAHAQRAGVGAALAAAAARAPPTVDEEMRVRAVALAAALARLPAPPACDGCGTTEAPKLLRCARCRTARFCSAACQQAAWRVHKLVCVAPAQETADGT